MKKEKKNFLAKYLLRYEWIVFLVSVVVLSFGILETFIVFRNHCPDLSRLASVNSSCSTPYCQAARASVLAIRGNSNQVIKIAIVSKSIFFGNLLATAYEASAIGYYGFAPLISLYKEASTIGIVATCAPSRLHLLLFPHGLIEISAMLLFFTLFYSTLINLVLLIAREVSSKKFFTSVGIQIGVIVLLYLVAAILESIAFVALHG